MIFSFPTGKPIKHRAIYDKNGLLGCCNAGADDDFIFCRGCEMQTGCPAAIKEMNVRCIQY